MLGRPTRYRFRGGRESICSLGVALRRTSEASGRCGENFSSSQAITRATATTGINRMRADTINTRGHTGGMFIGGLMGDDAGSALGGLGGSIGTGVGAASGSGGGGHPRRSSDQA